jgi:hypothetical protein
MYSSTERKQMIEKLNYQVKDCLDSNDFVGAKNQLDKIVAISKPVLPEIVFETN